MKTFDGKIETLRVMVKSPVICVTYNNSIPLYLLGHYEILYDLFNRRCAFDYELLTAEEYNERIVYVNKA